MSEEIMDYYPIAYLSKSNSAVTFTPGNTDAGSIPVGEGTCLPVRKMQNLLNVANWGEDNRFPQNVEQQMAYYGVGKAALDWKARGLYGNGILPGKIVRYEDEGKKEIFEPLDKIAYQKVYDFIDNRRMFRFWIEFLQDWVWYGNCFPELILSKDCTEITGIVHQESCDARYQQMDDNGKIKKVYLSKLWGASATQYVKFDPKRKMLGTIGDFKEPTEVDGKFVKSLHCVDMYDPVRSLQKIADKLKAKDGLKSAILPVNYPSPNKTYYQLCAWDGARLGGWIEIACKLPSLLKHLFNKAMHIKYHIKVPETYFWKLHGKKEWIAMPAKEKRDKRRDLLKKMDEYLTGADNAYSTFISIFDINEPDSKEYGKVEIDSIEDKLNVDKEILMSSAADAQNLIAMGVHPTLFGAGVIGTGHQRTGGSDQREAFLVYTALLNLERQVLLEPLYLVRDYNDWDKDIVFRFRDTILTTLDQNKGTEKVVS